MTHRSSAQAVAIAEVDVGNDARRAAASGTGVLRFAADGSRTVLTRAFATSPLKFLNPRAGSRGAWVYTATYGGGFVGGDTVRLSITLEPDTAAVVTTQSSTKIYRSTAAARQEVEARVSRGALLVTAPDPTVCFAGSSFDQMQRFDLAGDASLAVVDWMTSGRRASGEQWAFARYSARIDVRRDGKRILHDAIRLADDDGPVAGRMGRVHVLATLVLSGPAVREVARAAIVEAAGRPVVSRPDPLLSAAPLGDDGALVRVAGSSVEQVGALLRHYLQGLAPLLGGEVWGRKW